MGNTPSSPTSTKLTRDSSLISQPRALGSTRPRRHPLGPEYIISPFMDDASPPTSPPTNSSITAHHQPDTNHHDSFNSITQKLAHRRSQTLSVSWANLNESAVDIRRSRSANAAGSTRATRTSDFLGAPPPYSSDDPSSSTLQSFDTYDGFLGVPASSRWTKGHQRAASDDTPIHRRSPSEQTYASEYEQQTLSEEYGYGIGNGMRPESSHTRMAMPAPSFSNHASAPVSDTVSSPTSAFPSAVLREDPLELLKQYKTIFIIDDSASMTGERWVETREALASLADIAAKYDVNGIDVYFLNARRSAENMRTGASVKRQFDSVEPHGLSLLAKRLEELLHDYISELEQAQRDILRGDTHALRRIKPMNYIIITDGVPNDPEAVIIQAARRLDRGNLPVSQVGIQFVQVGNDPRATEALRELDDELAKEYGIRDMVDTTPYSGGPLDSELLIKILLGGINRRVDKKGASSVL